ncbi:IclR family transcriptional regulator [Salipiger abyssi]|uniref:IclR family transcriptional regulator n=1 Tax=Salipiger abyssi TaxID=1250539 RepID=UPI0040589450
MRQGARGIQSIEVSGRILRALVETCQPMMLKELAQAAELAPAQCHAYLTSLRHVGLVHQNPVTGLYSAGPFATRLGISWLRNSPLASGVMAELQRMSDTLQVISALAAWGSQGPTLIQVNASAWQSALNVRQGTTFSVTGTATGRIFAAFGDAPAISAQIDAEFAHDQNMPRGSIGTVLQRDAFAALLRETRGNGYAVAEGAPIPQTNAISVPIFDSDGVLQFAAGLIGPSDRLSLDPEGPAIQELLAIQARLSVAPPSQDSEPLLADTLENRS